MNYFKSDEHYPLLKPLKDNWRLFREDLDRFLDDERIDKSVFCIRSTAKRALRGGTDRWKTLGFITHGRDPVELAAEYGVEQLSSASRTEWFRANHFTKTRPFINEYAAVAEHGVVNAYLSYFEAGAKLGLHVNYDPYMYRSHLGLIVPEGDVAFKVCDEMVKWREGELLVFDPTNPHTAWNLTEHARIILIVDFLRPEEPRQKMVAMEREQFARMMKANPMSFGMSGGMYELDDETMRRYAVPRIEESRLPLDGSIP